jgi:hypothetical protein
VGSFLGTTPPLHLKHTSFLELRFGSAETRARLVIAAERDVWSFILANGRKAKSRSNFREVLGYQVEISLVYKKVYRKVRMLF